MLLAMFVAAACSLHAFPSNLEFKTLQNRDGLSNGQINGILKDSNGFLWFATEVGLDRFDGFRFRNFFFDNNDEKSLANNTVMSVQQDVTGDLWIRTAMGYCIYNYQMEKFDRNPSNWLQTINIKGSPERVFIDKNKDMWFFIYGKGVYFLDHTTMKSYLFRASTHGKNTVPVGSASKMSDAGDGCIAYTYKDGTVVKLDGKRRRVVFIDRHIYNATIGKNSRYSLFVDSKGNYWVGGNGGGFVYSAAHRKWFDNVPEFFRACGIPCADQEILIKEVDEDKEGNIWIASDHLGLYVLNIKKKRLDNYRYEENIKGTISDNTIQSVYIDDNGCAWLGGYKNGLAFYSPNSSRYETIPIGDICTITEDGIGNLWCGSNVDGIIVYNPVTGQKINYRKEQTKMKSDVVVSSLTARDGSLYFGGFNGGLARYKDGQWTNWYADGKPGGLANDCVWSLTEDGYGNIVIATLGGGLQILEPRSGQFLTYNQANSSLPNDFLNSVSISPKGNIVIGHSVNFSTMDVRTKEIKNYQQTKDGKFFISPTINQMIVDSRGIVWMATPSGMQMYDPETGQLETLDNLNGSPSTMGCSVIEDGEHRIWLVSDHSVSNVKVSRNDEGKWDLFITTFNNLDGLQEHQFNYRSICLTRSGNIVVGGQDGINIIPTLHATRSKRHDKAVFSGLMLFDSYVGAGDKFNDRVIIEESLNRVRRLELNHGENAFTIQLASDHVTVPSRNRFLYRLVGFNDKWIMTSEGVPSVTFTNLESGNYTLQVKVVNGDGTVNDDISEMEIRINPPFYLSLWAKFFYLMVALGIAFWYRRRSLKKQKVKFMAEAEAEEQRRKREIDELRLNFFTNISHELRTPLTLILSPITSMIKSESDPHKKEKMQLIQRNAQRLLGLVNQVLDFRKMDKEQEKLNALMDDIVMFVKNICKSFKMLGGKDIALSFNSDVSALTMLFDADKINKVVNNLLSNAYKFTPEGGKVDVFMRVVLKNVEEGRTEDMIEIDVSDSGPGISDEEKKKIFERFYQVDGTKMQPYGGSGIGLNLVQDFVKMHDGVVSVKDNPGGGSIFVVMLPIKFDVSKPSVHGSAFVAPVEVSNPYSDMAKEKAIAQVSQLKAEGEGDNAATGKNGNAGGNKKNDARETARKAAAAAAAKTDAVYVKAASVHRRPLLLLVDDSEDFRKFMGGELSAFYDMIYAVDGKDGLEKIREHHPDLILSDVMMPVMDGNEFCRQVKDDPEMQNIPFVMLTARLTQEQRIEGLENGADEYITKPFNFDILRLRIENLIKWRRRDSSHEAKGSGGLEGQEDAMHLSAMDEKLLNEVNKYIQENMSDEDMSVESMSSAVNMSRVQLYRRMVSITGTTPSEYIRMQRMKKAESMLHDNDHTVSEIAYSVGFNNPRYFTKYFAEMYGETPSQYRKKFVKK